jgi:hypothetical protein
MKDISYQPLLEEASEMTARISSGELEVEDWHLDFYDTELDFVLLVKWREIPIPFHLKVRPVEGDVPYVEPDVYRTQLIREQDISYCKYPQELEVVECFYDILESLELIGGMDPYAEIYRILTSQPFDGRHIEQTMEQYGTRRIITNLESRWREVCGYGTYTYMKKRWNRYRKEQPFFTEADGWERVIELMIHFFSPVLEALDKNEIFMGDWMPQLGRYL